MVNNALDGQFQHLLPVYLDLVLFGQLELQFLDVDVSDVLHHLHRVQLDLRLYSPNEILALVLRPSQQFFLGDNGDLIVFDGKDLEEDEAKVLIEGVLELELLGLLYR